MRFRRPLPFLCLLALAAMAMAAVHAPSAQAQDAPTAVVIQQILVEGNQRIEVETVRSYMVVEPGDEYDDERVDRSLKALFATGLFADVSIRREGSDLIVQVVENPIINRLAFDGNKKIDDEKLGEEVRLRPRIVYTRARVQADLQRIIQIYRRAGRFAATIEPKVIQLPQNRVDLIFEINEGDVTGVSRINFLGNTHFSDGDLKDAIATQESRWWKFLTTDDNYDPDRLAFDQEELRKFYLSKGYADFRVLSAVAELTRDRKNFYITFTVEEGEQYRLGEVVIDSVIRDLSSDLLMPLATTEVGNVYNADDVDASIEEMTFVAGKLGYAFLDIRPRLEKDREERLIKLTYRVLETPRVYVERINIRGNVRTLDTVIRRQFRLTEGDPFNTQKLRRSRQRIRALGFFQEVEIDQRPGSQDDRTIIDVEVQERSTGELTLGAGFSGTENFLGELSIRQRNLLGKGQDLRLRLSISSITQQIDLSFTEPYFMNRPVAAGIDLFTRRRNLQFRSGFDEQSNGFGIRFGFPISEYVRVGARYSLRQDKIKDVDIFASRFIKAQEGTQVISSVGYSLIYDIRDDVINPSTGYVFTLSQDFAGVGGTVRYLRNTLNFAYYHPIWKRFVAKIALEEGYIVGLGEDVKLNDRFFVGGDNFRGFELGGIGPRDLLSDDSLGGNMYWVGEAAIEFPLGLPNELNVRGSLFLNFGSLADADDVGRDPADSCLDPVFANANPFVCLSQVVDRGSIRVTAGIGISWWSPFGPIRIDFAQAIRKEAFDKTEFFRFSVGSRF